MLVIKRFEDFKYFLIVLKKGKCPASLRSLGGVCVGERDVPSCKNDEVCPGGELCCRSECGINVCSPPGKMT